MNKLKEMTPVSISEYSHKSLLETLVKLLPKLPPLSDSMLLTYLEQKTKKEIISYDVNYDDSFLENNLSWAMEYWMGKRQARSVGKKNKWKCTYCTYKPICPFQNEENS